MPNPGLVESFRRASRVAAITIMIVGGFVFLGWALDHPLLNRLLSGRFIMQLNTGAAFILAGAGILWPTRRRSFAIGCALGVTAIGAGVLVQYFRLPGHPGRMEAETAINFVLVGGALALRRSRLIKYAHTLTILAALGTLIALFGHVYTPKFAYGITLYSQMTFGTLVTFMVLCLGILCADPDRGVMAPITRDSTGGFMARRLYPAVILIPLTLGWLVLLGEQNRLFNGKFGLSVLLLSSIVVFVTLISIFTRSLERTDARRMRLQALLLEEAERRNIAKELHDEIGQTLTALKLHLERTDAGPAQALVSELMARVSNLSLDLRPAMLDDLGLLPALLWLTERYTAQTRVLVQLEHSGLGRRFVPAVETAAFRIVQEALTNVARHAAVDRVTVRVWAHEASLGIQIADTGRGFAPEPVLAAGASSGLSGMRERAEALGGQLSIESAPGEGARLTAEIPLDPSLAAPGRAS